MQKSGPQETFVEKIARKFGVSVSRIETLGSNYQARYLRRLFSLLEVDLVLDVGGNAGQFARFIRGPVGYKGPLVTFEPLPDLAALMKRDSAGDENWQIVNAAVGDKEGVLELNVMESSPLSSFHAPSDEQSQRLSAINRVKSTIPVEVVTIDGFLAKAAAAAPQGCRNVYLKLDVQGFEEQCLDGARASLGRIAALQAELSALSIYHGVAKYYDLMRKIEELGFLLSLVPPHNASHFPEIIDFDCHFVSADRLRALGILRGNGGPA